MNHFAVAWKHTGLAEGGYVNDPSDSGGETNWGITEKVARANGYTGRMIDLTRDEAEHIGKQEYWDTMSLDSVAAVHPELAYEMFDTGFNMGQKRAQEFLQRCLNVFNRKQKDYADIVVDGDVGPGTIGALQRYYNKRGRNGRVVMLRAMNSLQGAFYIELAEQREKDEAFVNGWFLNRVVI